MSLFKQYLKESYKEYHYRIKTVVPLDADKMDMVENILKKYDLKDISSPRQTPIQENPLEFYDIQNREVYIVDAITAMPASSYILRSEIHEVLNIPENYIVVRADNDPLEIYTSQLNDDKEYKVKLSTDEDYNEEEKITEEPAFGDQYNEKFLSRIARARMTIDSEVKEDKAQFNDGHDGVKPHYGKPSNEESKRPATGNFDDESLDKVDDKDKIR